MAKARKASKSNSDSHSLALPTEFDTEARTIRDLINSKACLECVDQHGNAPLLLAVKHNHLADVSLLLSNKANIEARNNHGCNALMLAAMHANARNGPLIDRLIGAKAAVDKKNKQGKTPLMVAAYHSNHIVVKKLLSATANVDSCDELSLTRGWYLVNHSVEHPIRRFTILCSPFSFASVVVPRPSSR